MKQMISTEELKNGAGDVINTVRLRGDVYIVSRYGKPAAAVVPLSMLEQSERAYRKLGESMERMAARAPEMTENELEMLVTEEISAVRQKSRLEPPAS